MDYAIRLLELDRLKQQRALEEAQNRERALVFFGEDVPYIQETRKKIAGLERRIQMIDDAIDVLEKVGSE